MAASAPMSALTNYNTVLSQVSDSTPVRLTKGGRDKYVIETSEAHDYKEAYLRFLEEMSKVNRPDTQWFSVDEAKERLGLDV